MSRHGWQTINESYMAIEEIVREVLLLPSLPEYSLG
jgi:regulator of PEP synthase PpsR (kinase-PPPase family)